MFGLNKNSVNLKVIFTRFAGGGPDGGPADGPDGRVLAASLDDRLAVLAYWWREGELGEFGGYR